VELFPLHYYAIVNVELVINRTPKGVEIAVLHDRQLVELHQEDSNRNYAVGDIYLGKVRKLVPHLNAAFVEVGHERDAFLHYLDLGPHFTTTLQYVRSVMTGTQRSADLNGLKMLPDIPKDGKIKDQVGQSNPILVQVAKEPISNKGPRITCEITLAGRYLVLVPFSNKISLSSRIEDDKERDRLRKLIQSIRPANMGVIIRTQAEHTTVSELDQDLQDLMSRWNQTVKALPQAKAPQKILGELDKTSSILRDILSDQFSNIHVNDAKLAATVRKFLHSSAPELEGIVKEHKIDDLFDAFNVHRQIKSSFAKQVNLKSGSYLIVEHTEAMHVIDVNSGNRKQASVKDQEENALQTNLECAREIARLLRLRDMGGIICIDFIDMQNKENQKKLHEELKNAMKTDKAKHNVLAPSRFGVVEITRERVKPVTQVKTTEKCPSCHGKGVVEASVLFTDQLENQLRIISTELKHRQITMVVHPMVHAYVTKGWWSNIKKNWQSKFGIKIQLDASSSNELLEAHYFDSEGQEISL
jgi:ribonuclease G